MVGVIGRLTLFCKTLKGLAKSFELIIFLISKGHTMELPIILLKFLIFLGLMLLKIGAALVAACTVLLFNVCMVLCVE